MEELIVIRTIEELEALKDYIADKDYIAFDTETTGLTNDSIIIGFSICADVNIAYYIVIASWDVETQSLQYLGTKEGVKSFIEHLKGKQLIMHNASYDCNMVKLNYNVELMPYVHTDTLLLGHLLDENRSNGLKELGVSLFGLDAKKEQEEMKQSVTNNGGSMTKESYELYKADSELIARYGAKDTILTLKLFYTLVPILIEEGLDPFFYDEETMPLLRGPTYQLNTVGLSVDPEKLRVLKSTLETECLEAKAFIHNEIAPHIKDKYPGTKPANTFNIGATQQLSWLLFIQLGNEFNTLTENGRELCKALDMKLPYSYAQRRQFIQILQERKGQVWQQPKYNYKTKKYGRPKKIADSWTYMSCGKESLTKLSKKYAWVTKLLEYSKNLKLLNTYVHGIEEKSRYNIIRPSFLQHGTTSGRYSSRKPNFQNLPRDDKRVKSCIVSRPERVFVGADYSQLEPRVFASLSKDKRLLDCFAKGEDFYSVIGVEVFEKYGCSLIKNDKNSFANLYPELRQIAKVVALSATYGTTAPKMAVALGKSMDEAQDIINNYFEKFPKVQEMMLTTHKAVKESGVVHNLYGRPRRMPKAKDISKIYGPNVKHSELPYEIRNLLNLSVNHIIQSTAASIVNRASIAFNEALIKYQIKQCSIVLQVHDEIVAECHAEDAEIVAEIMKNSMETAVILPGVQLLAEPKIANNLAELK